MTCIPRYNKRVLKKKDFSKDEASTIHHLMDRYCKFNQTKKACSVGGPRHICFWR